MRQDQIVAGGVALAAFACSAQHIYTVALSSGNPWPIALTHPIGLDGLIYIGMRAVSSGRRWRGWLATVYGAAMSLAFNSVSYAHVPMPAWVMGLAMPVALVLAVLVVHGAREPEPQMTEPSSPPAEPAPQPVKTIPAPPEQHPEKPVIVQPAKPAGNPQPRPQGVHIRDGRELRGAELRDDAELLMTDSIGIERPNGMTAAELAALYEPPLSRRTAESFAASARKRVRDSRVNGHQPDALAVP